MVILQVTDCLEPNKVNFFIEKLLLLKKLMPAYADYTLHGGISYIAMVHNAHKYALEKNLFVLKTTGAETSIINAPGFKPRCF